MKAACEKHSFDMMLELAVGLDDDAVREVLQVLLKKYAGSESGGTAGSSLAPRGARRKPDVPKS